MKVVSLQVDTLNFCTLSIDTLSVDTLIVNTLHVDTLSVDTLQAGQCNVVKHFTSRPPGGAALSLARPGRGPGSWWPSWSWGGGILAGIRVTWPREGF